MRKVLFLLLLSVFLAGVLLFLSEDEVEVKQESAQGPQTQTKEESVPEEEPVLILSAGQAEQSDTLVARVKGLPAGIVPRGTFFSKQVSFFPAEDSWFAILGIGAKREPGIYVFEADFGEQVETREIQVAKRDFPVTKLVVTEELQGKGYNPESIAQNIAGVENKALQEVLTGYTSVFYADKEFFYPLSVIDVVGAYGNIRKSGGVSLQHLGVDLAADTGTPVYAVNDGVVVLLRDFTDYGKTLVVDHGFGIYSLYLHLSETFAKEEDFVSRGEVIAYSGNTGYSIAPHLHFSMKVAGESVDPLSFIETVNREF